MSNLERLVDISTALANGVYSVGVDLVYGAQRTGQGLGLSGSERVSEIGYENRALADMLKKTVTTGVSTKNNPIYQTVFYLLTRYYSIFPDSAIETLARNAEIGGAYTGGRMVLGKKLAEIVATRIAVAIAASSTYKAVATRVGASTAASSTGTGAPIGLTMVQGLLQRSSLASHRLRERHPDTYIFLKKKGDLQLIYFLVEEPMAPYLTAIKAAKDDPGAIGKAIEVIYD